MTKRIREEIASIRERDPAIKTAFEVYFLYPSYKALRSYRKAHWFYKRGWYFWASWISQRARKKTGIEIHPGAKIGKALFIDHGSGVVIGETAEIGDYCTIYQGVTLGGTGKDTGKRHPTLGNNVLVGSGAKVLGPFKVGDNSKIAANAVVLKEVPPNCTAVGVPARVVKRDGIKEPLRSGAGYSYCTEDLDHIHVPDPIAQQLEMLTEKIQYLHKEVEKLSKE